MHVTAVGYRHLTWQPCDAARVDQQWDDAGDGTIRAAAAPLCVTDGPAAGGVDARPCVAGAQNQAWRLARDSQFSAAVANAHPVPRKRLVGFERTAVAAGSY